MLPEASRAYMPAMPVAVDINSQVLIVVRPLFLEGVGLKGHHQSIGLKAHQSIGLKAHQSIGHKAHQSIGLKAHQSIGLKAHQSIGLKAHQSIGLKAHQSIGLKTSYTSMMKMPLAADINR